MAVHLIRKNLNEAEGDYIKIGNTVLPTNAANMGNADYDTVARMGKQKYDAEKKAEEDERKRQAAIEKGKDYQEKIDELINQGKDPIDAYFEVLVPGNGKADTVAGELVRAMMRILYRDWNDGDRFFAGYGMETAMPSAAYIMDTLGGAIKNTLVDIAESELEEDSYTAAIENVSDMLIKHLKDHPELLGEDNTNDGRYWRVSSEYEKLEQKYDYDFSLPWQIEELVDRGDVSENEIEWELSDWEYFKNCEIEVWSDSVEVHGLTEEQYDEIRQYLDKSLESWGEDWAEEYGLDDEDDLDESVLHEGTSPYTVARYKGNQYGIWDEVSCTWVTFGKKTDLEKRAKKLNAIATPETPQQRADRVKYHLRDEGCHSRKRVKRNKKVNEGSYDTEDIFNDVYRALENANTKIGKKAFDALDREDIVSIIVNDGVFWFEELQYGHHCSKEVKDYLKNFIKKTYGYEYLYDKHPFK